MSIDTLYLGSQSQSRKKLLEETGYTFKVLDHTSDEQITTHTEHDFSNYVLAIAQHKMDSLILPEHDAHKTGDTIFVLTADTMVRTKNSHQVFGKPRDKEHALYMLQTYRNEAVEVATGCCLERKKWENGAWVRDETRAWTTVASVEFVVGQDDVDLFIKQVPLVMHAAGAAIIEGFGQNFCKSIQGAYSSIMGLPMFELRQVLKDLGFKF
ncbi:MAG: Maf family protein [bacterium]